MKKSIFVLFIFSVLFLISCENPVEMAHQHTFSADWKYNELTHWHEATCEHRDIVSGMSQHIFIIKDDKKQCNCGFVLEDINSDEDEILNDLIDGKIFNDEEFHWNYVFIKGKLEKENVQKHSFSENVISTPNCNAEGVKKMVCTECSFEKEEVVPKLNHSFSRLIKVSKDTVIYECEFCKRVKEDVNLCDHTNHSWQFDSVGPYYKNQDTINFINRYYNCEKKLDYDENDNDNGCVFYLLFDICACGALLDLDMDLFHFGVYWSIDRGVNEQGEPFVYRMDIYDDKCKKKWSKVGDNVSGFESELGVYSAPFIFENGNLVPMSNDSDYGISEDLLLQNGFISEFFD